MLPHLANGPAAASGLADDLLPPPPGNRAGPGSAFFSCVAYDFAGDRSCKVGQRLLNFSLVAA